MSQMLDKAVVTVNQTELIERIAVLEEELRILKAEASLPRGGREPKRFRDFYGCWAGKVEIRDEDIEAAKSGLNPDRRGC
jgi:hypothetical protein